MKRKALFVGIDNYTRGIPALSCARNDANALLEYFMKHGYAEDDVSILRDGRTSEILDELDEQTKRLKPGDLFLFFFAGHGYTIEKSDGSFDRCLAGADDRRDRIMMGKEGISLSEIKDRADKARCPFVVILDACQTKIDTSRAADISQADVCNQRDLLAISSVVNRKSTSGLSIPFVVINSCDVGEVAYELKEKEQGLFTFAMLETLKQMENPVFDERLLALISSRMGEHGSGYSQHPKLMLADASNIFDIPIFPAADSSHETLVVCPVCGDYNVITDTFRCKTCERDHLCKKHRDETEHCCEDCAAAKRKTRETAERKAAVNIGAVPDGEHKKIQLWKDGPYWADTNIGAEKPWESGYYFWWGDTVGYKFEDGIWVASDSSSRGFSFEKKKNVPTLGNGISALRKKRWITADDTLTPEHDAAQVQWGGGWRIPTEQELCDLCNKCDWTWKDTNGVGGYVIRGRGAYTSASIFLPAAGYGYGTSLRIAGSYGNYWSSVPDSVSNYGSWFLYFDSSGHDSDYYDRRYGQSIRPVQEFIK